MTPAPLAVGVDAANLLRDRRGIGRYVRGLLRTWHESYAARIEPTLLLPGLFLGGRARALASDLGFEDVRIARRWAPTHPGLSLVWFPWNGMTWTPAVPAVVTIQDVWPFVSPATDTRRRRREQSHYRLAATRAARFIAGSEHTAREAASALGIPRSRMDVVLHGVDDIVRGEPEPARFADADRYVLFVGENEPRKDLATLLRAMPLLPEPARSDTALVVVGRGGAAAAQTDGVRAIALGEVTDERLASLYSGAAALAFPSRHEGFGLPVLEAMRFGTPVVASDATAIPEAGGDAALYFRAGDERALAAALGRVLLEPDLARSMAAAGRSRAAAMTVRRCAEQTLEVFERVAGRRSD